MPMLQLQGISLEFPDKICFSEFSGSIEYGQRIAVLGSVPPPTRIGDLDLH